MSCLARSVARVASRKASSAAATAIKEVDVAIVGSGIVGSAMAGTLATNPQTSHLKVAVIEPREPKLPKESLVPSLRCVALSKASYDLCGQLGVWDNGVGAVSVENKGKNPQELSFSETATFHTAGAPVHAQPFRQMQVWDASSPGRVNWGTRPSLLGGSSKASEKDPLGWIVGNDHLQYALWEAAMDAGVEGVVGKKVVSCEVPSAHPHNIRGEPSNNLSQGGVLTLDSGEVIKARLIIGADGAFSPLKKMIGSTHGLQTSRHEYGASGVVATLRVEGSGGAAAAETAFQRFLPDGPLALLPVAPGISSIVWSTTPRHAQELCDMPKDKLVQELNMVLQDVAPMRKGRNVSGALGLAAALAAPLGQKGLPDPPVVLSVDSPAVKFPFATQWVHNPTAPRTVLIGDASHVVHPICGQGVNLGLLDVQAVAKLVSEATVSGQDIGGSLLTTAYTRHSAIDVLPRVLGIHGLYLSFVAAESLPEPIAAPLRALRTIGMSVVDRVPPLKSALIKVAAGRSIFEKLGHKTALR